MRAVPPGDSSKASSPAPSRSSNGRAYPGPQPILSDPENPTNQQQTIIQPAAEKPKLLEQFVPLPNMVKIAKPKLQLPGDLLAAKPELPEFHPEVRPERPRLSRRSSIPSWRCQRRFLGTDPARGRDPSSGSRQSGRATLNSARNRPREQTTKRWSCSAQPQPCRRTLRRFPWVRLAVGLGF